MSEYNLGLSPKKDKIYINKELYGEDRVIYVNTSDEGIIVRAKNARKNLAAYLKTIEKREADGVEEDNDKYAVELEKAEKYIREQIDYIFDGEVSSAVFGNASTTADYDGVPYVEAFLNAIMPVIESRIKAAKDASEKRISAYTAKYVK